MIRASADAIQFTGLVADRVRGRRFVRAAAAVVIAAAAYLVLAGWVPNGETAEDSQAIALLRADPHCHDRSSFDAALRCIRYVQASVVHMGLLGCPAKGQTIEPMAFVRRGYGCCFDRARFIEKALRHYGYKTRRAALYESRYGLAGLLVPRIDSHAVTEVWTVRGWLGVDSEQPFVLITRGGQPLRFTQYHSAVARDLAEGPRGIHSFGYGHPYYVIYGLYSRHGGFYGPNLPAPELNYAEFVRYMVLRRD